MAFLRRSFSRFVNAVRHGAAESALAREIDAHLALLQDEFERRGMSAEDARYAARRAFGGVEQAQEHQRDARSFRWVDDAGRDLRHAVRLLRRAPLFTLTAALSVAIGIAATSA